MKLPKGKYAIVYSLLLAGAIYAIFIGLGTPKVDFNTQIKPLLNQKCIACHGGVKRQGGFSLLFRTDALAPTESGKPAIIPGRPDASEMIKRLTHKDLEERMPYKEAPLSKEEIQLLRRWIKQGAEWGEHWAYTPLAEVNVPKPKGKLWGLLPAKKSNWVKNDIDYYILAKLNQEKLQPSPEADKKTLLRRVSLDLIGLPPSEDLKNQFLSDNSPKAYENLVDSLLASPHFGERWAAMWMDLARYADTKGYERDDARSIWRYRDWLINAFNHDMPYNDFLTEQIAGDLLPNATDNQLIATAFHRNTMTNDEGGTDNEEFRVAAVMDRVNTTWETLMGTTFACVQCHSHPYDPFRHEEYYKFMAFFNNTRDEDTYADYPLLREYHGTDSLKFLEVQKWLKTNLPEQEKDITHFLKTLQPSINSLTAVDLQNSALADEKWLVLRKNGSAKLANVDLTGKNKLIFPYNTWTPGGILTITIDSLKGKILHQIKLNNNPGRQFADIEIPIITGVHDVYLHYANAQMQLFTQTGIQFDWFYFTKKWEKSNNDIYKKYWELIKSNNYDATPVMLENPADMQRPTFVFERGNWLVHGDEVQPDVPQSLHPLLENAPRNRLGLAMWLTDSRNPLTARTYVNRIWEQLFGQGLAETLEDMGTQGIPPTHRELLDYLAYNFITKDKWSTKTLLKKIVLSATYRQESKVTAELQERDPFNKFYARASRVRLSAEQVRDQALAVSGLLNPKMYGKSVFPYQPDGIWSSPWNGATWVQDTAGNQYRRAIYTYWKRSSPYPAMVTFDGVNREVCVSRRIRTNTPLQALVTLNDSTYLVAAVALAKKMADYDIKLAKQIEFGFETAISQPITIEKRKILEQLYQTAIHDFSKKLIKNEVNKSTATLLDQPPNVAALAVVASAILNLDEFVNKG
ncbi:MAG: DUF1553 domain-containing protein [Saprospiraceae bacterium]|nr:DUF1553 domain-containing protein [Saprospiraceae bacterium]